MKLVRWTATGLGLGVFSGFMGGLLRSRSATEVWRHSQNGTGHPAARSSR
jgi:hypothetical protein